MISSPVGKTSFALLSDSGIFEPSTPSGDVRDGAQAGAAILTAEDSGRLTRRSESVAD